MSEFPLALIVGSGPETGRFRRYDWGKGSLEVFERRVVSSVFQNVFRAHELGT
jgi:hypothetical protein